MWVNKGLTNIHLWSKKKKNQNNGCFARKNGWWLGRGMRKLFEVIVVFYILVEIWVKRIYSFVKISECTIRFVHYIICKFHQRKTVNKYRCLLDGMHTEVLRGKYTHICYLLWHVSKININWWMTIYVIKQI